MDPSITCSGDIEICCVSEGVKFNTLLGDISLANIVGGVHATSSFGDVDVDVKRGGLRQRVGKVKVGRCFLVLPEKMNAELEAHVFNGDISVRANGERHSREGGEVRLTLGTGGSTVRGSTVSGDVAVRVGR